jgi:hypothetical protein
MAKKTTPTMQTSDYANLLNIVMAGIEATGARTDNGLVRSLQAYAAALDLTDCQTGGEIGMLNPTDIRHARELCEPYFDPTRNEEMQTLAEAFAEHFADNG